MKTQSRLSDPGGFGRVAVLMGGSSSEREVSLDSGRNVLDALVRRGVNAEAVDGIPALVPLLVDHRIDRVFNILHGQRGGGEDGVLQASRRICRALHRVGRARFGAVDGQDPHQTGGSRSTCRRRDTCGSDRTTT